MTGKLSVAFVAYDGMTLLDLVGPYEILTLWPDISASVVAEHPGPVVPDSRAMPILAQASFAETLAPDIIVFPGGPTAEEASRQRALHRWLAQVAPRATCVFSVCTGAFHLAEAGLLRGRRATTHWAMLDQLERFGAQARVARWVDDGAILTAAGVSAGLDAALYLTSRMQGDALAKAIQLMIEYDPAPPFNAGSTISAGEDVVGTVGPLLAPAMARRRT